MRKRILTILFLILATILVGRAIIKEAKFTPGLIHGKPVRVKPMLPFSFQ